jgi:hypothetical protein
MASSRVREVFERGTEAFNAHDIDSFAESMAADVSVRAPGGVERSGKEAVKAFYRSWLDAFPDARVRIDAVHVLDDVAIEEGVFGGTHLGPLSGPEGDLPPTGRAVSVEYIQVVRFRRDEVVSYHLVFDRAELFEQLGLAVSAEEEHASGWHGEASESVQPN